MGLFSSNKGVSGNSGNASGGRWNLTRSADAKRAVGAIRKEWKAPRSGDLAHRASHRPGHKK
jgi:hypothetical protein